jgi:hypothetical protein
LKNAKSIEEAVAEFYDNPKKYSSNTAPTMPTSSDVPNAAILASRRPPQQHHTNAVIEAGHVRARDEVSLVVFRKMLNLY